MKSLAPSWCVALGVVLAGCTVPSLEELENERGLEVEVAFNFKAGCIKVQAVDTKRPDANRFEEAVLVWERAATNRVVKISVLRGFGWNRTLNIITTAHERNCDGKPVATDNRQMTLDRDGVKNLKFALSAPDEDGDGYIPTAAGGTDCDDVSAVSNPEAPEVCDKWDNNCAGGVDEGLARTEYFRDVDGDGVGVGTGVLDCAAPGGYAAVGGDCDDNDWYRAPGKAELCDNRDNDCAGGVDEPFITGAQAKGAACNTDICAGTFVCNAAGTATECSARPPTAYYPDLDQDGQGSASATVVRVCAPNAPPANHV